MVDTEHNSQNSFHHIQHHNACQELNPINERSACVAPVGNAWRLLVSTGLMYKRKSIKQRCADSLLHYYKKRKSSIKLKPIVHMNKITHVSWICIIFQIWISIMCWSSDADVLQRVIPADRTEYNLHVTNMNFVFKCGLSLSLFLGKFYQRLLYL